MVDGMSQLTDNPEVLAALKAGEEQTIHAYEEALQDEDLSAPSKVLIRSTLLPQTRLHIPMLDRLITRK
jgi:hypothetical protein